MIPALVMPIKRRNLIIPAYDAQSGGNGQNLGSDTWTHTVGSGLTNSMLIVLTCVTATTANGNSTTGVTVGGSAMTPIAGAAGFSNSSTSRILEMWYFKNPPAGANSIVASFNTSSSINNACCSISLQHVDQNNPFGIASESDGTSANSASVSIASSSTKDLIIAGIAVRNNPVTSGGSLTPRSSNSQGTSTYTQISTTPGTGSSVSAPYTWSSADNFVLVGFAVHGSTS